MDMKDFNNGVKYFIGAGVTATLLMGQGCLATRDWVRENVNDPLSGRISQTEGRLDGHDGQIGSLGNRMTGVEGKLGQFEGRLGQVVPPTYLNAIANLRLERKLSST
jgi:hypothetical protein